VLGSLGYTAGGKQAARNPAADPKDKLAEQEAYERGLTLLYTGRYDQAILTLRRIVSGDARNLPALGALGEAYLRSGNAARLSSYGNRRWNAIRRTGRPRIDRRILAGAQGFRQGLPVCASRAAMQGAVSSPGLRHKEWRNSPLLMNSRESEHRVRKASFFQELCIRARLEPCRGSGKGLGFSPCGLRKGPVAKAFVCRRLAARLKPVP